MSQDATLLEIRELEAEYEILGELGRGGMAIVYLARDRELGRQVAIKVIHAAAGADEATVGHQLVEARTVAQLQHPSVAAIYAVKRLSTLGLALVMQYVPGRTLERAMREDGAFSPERTEAVLTDIAAALAYAHARGVIHRDIKPDNIFLNDETGRALLSDFGIALSAETGRQQTTDVIVGTPAYMSPEQIDGAELDGRSDVFSLGLIGYEMLTGVRAWVDENISDVMYRQKFEALPPLADLRPDVPDRLRAAIERATAKSREDRWPTAAAFLAAITNDEWVPEGRDAPAGGPATPNRIPPHLVPTTPRPFGGPAAAGTPLETVQYRRDDVPTPRQAVHAARAPQRGRRRARRVVLPIALLVIAATAVVVRHPALLPRRVGHGPIPEGDSVARLQAATITALRDSAVRALAAAAEAARRAADSATAVAASNADSTAALRLAAIKDSLIKAAADARQTTTVSLPAPSSRSTPAAGRTPAPETASGARHEPVPAPTPPPPELTPIHPPSAPTVVAGGTHSCIVAADGAVSCWGGNDRGQLGVGTTGHRSAPTRVSSDLSFGQVSAGIAHSCAIARSGSAYCWGDNTYGQLGDSGATTQLAPARVSGGHTFRVVATGTTHTCALATSGDVWCWGRNLYGQLGNGSTQDQSSPVRVESSAHFVALSVGWNHSCALDDVGHAFCWGQNSAGQLGDGTTIVRAVPVAVGGGLVFRAIAAGGSHSCALTPEGEAYCWGRNRAGQLGTGDGHDHSLPTKVATNGVFTTITAGGVHTCGLARSGDALCWGRNTYGQLGDGTTTDRPTPVSVSGGLSFVAIQASGAHTCASATTGGTYCWGDNSDGQLGDGTTTDRSEPVSVSGAR